MTYKKPARFIALALTISLIAPLRLPAQQPVPSQVAAKGAAPAAQPAQQGAETAAPMVQLYMAPGWQPPQDLENSFHLYVGETRVVKLSSPVAKTAVGNGKVVSTAMVNASDLLIIANDAGRSTVHLWLKDGSETTYAVEVGLNSPAKTYAQVRDMLAKEDNIQVSLVGNRVFLRAETLKATQIPFIAALQKAFPDQIVLITGSDVALEERTVHLTAQLVEIKRSALENLGIEWSQSIYGPQAAIVGDMKRLKSADGSVTVLRPQGNSNNNNSNSTPNLDAWPGYTHPFKSALSLATMISSRINLLRNQGDAYLVAEPRLTTRCGGKADFTSGGELPIPVQNGLGAANVQFKEYGIRLAVEPTCDKLGNIRAKVSTEVSQIDTAVAVMGVPGLLTRKAMSELDLVEGQSMLLSGLASYTAGESENAVPFLGSIPLLGHLFKSSNKNGERTELIVIITPSFISSDSEAIRKSEERRNQLRGEANDKLNGYDVKPLDWKPPPPPPPSPRDNLGVEGADIRNIMYAGSTAPAAAVAQPAPAVPVPVAMPVQAAVRPSVQQYTLTGEAPWRPKGVWDDGQRTVIEMPEGIPADRAPVLLIVKPAASATNKDVGYRMDGPRYLVDGMFDKAVLVAGSGYYRQSVMIERRP
ncbi:MAG: pilus assembly protein N-terminal domain-containing protein [Betaproteobacteria bacterium]|nr:pilus assembly protein N-terminal domain-containing protein [Betaproteobacteria bacterium]